MKFNKSFLIAVLPMAIWTASAPAIDRADYVASVVEILQTHTRLLEDLAGGERFKYSDNLVRHATAVEQTFGLLGPMEWHTARSARLHAQMNAGDRSLDEGTFETLAETSQKSLKDLVRAAHESMEEHDADGMLTAIENMKSACNDCHKLLPANTAPDVWGSIPSE